MGPGNPSERLLDNHHNTRGFLRIHKPHRSRCCFLLLLSPSTLVPPQHQVVIDRVPMIMMNCLPKLPNVFRSTPTSRGFLPPVCCTYWAILAVTFLGLSALRLSACMSEERRSSGPKFANKWLQRSNFIPLILIVPVLMNQTSVKLKATYQQQNVGVGIPNKQEWRGHLVLTVVEP